MEIKAYNFETVEELDLSTGEKGGWLKIDKNESAKVRFVKDFVVVRSYWLEEGESKSSYRIPAGCEEPVRMKGLAASYRVLFYVLDREDGEVKIYQAPYSVYKALKELRSNEDWRFEGLPHFDVTIQRIDAKNTITKYNVVASPNTKELDAEMQKQIEELDSMAKVAQSLLEGDDERFKEKYGYSIYSEPQKEVTPTEDKEIDINDLPF